MNNIVIYAIEPERNIPWQEWLEALKIASKQFPNVLIENYETNEALIRCLTQDHAQEFIQYVSGILHCIINKKLSNIKHA
jgi:ribosomal protein S17E